MRQTGGIEAAGGPETFAAQAGPPPGITLKGTSADETLTGGEGGDTISGAGGADLLLGGKGADLLYGDAAGSTSRLNDGADAIFGGGGDDLIYSSYGDDSADGGGGRDMLVLTTDLIVGGVSVDYSGFLAGEAQTISDMMGGEDHIAGIERLQIWGTQWADTIVGSDFSDVIISWGGADHIDAGGGDDLIDATWAESATILGGDGDDRMLAEPVAGRSVFRGGAGEDTFTVIDPSDSAPAMRWKGDRLSLAWEEWGAAQQISEVEAIRYFHAGDGTATLTGGSGGDFLGTTGVAGRLSGGDGDDSLQVLKGVHTLLGGAGDDRLSSGAGADRLVGGSGSDVFRFSTGSGVDLIVDLEARDVIDLSAIDANETVDGNQRFKVVDDFGARPGQAMLSYDDARDRTLLQLDTDGDRVADMTLVLADGDHTGFTGFVL